MDDSQEPSGKANTDTNPESTEDSQASINEGIAKQAPSQSVHNLWTGAHGSFANFFNPFTMLNPAAYMGMMYPMMGMMGTMYNFPVDMMTQPWAMDMMMRSMNPHLLFGMFGHADSAYKGGKVPEHLPAVRIPFFPTQNYQNWPKNKVSPGVSREAKKNAFQTAMAFSPLSMRDMISIMTDKMPIQEGVSWDDAVEAMKLRANELNFKFVGSSPLWKEIEAVTEKPSAKVEMFRFCDAAVARKILDEIPEFVIFLPCQISLIEDGEGKLWVMTMDWSIEWLDFAQNPNSHLAKDLRQDAIRIREAMTYIMEGAATGEF
ncbi:MAG: DUF302 domain-containing protein [Gammaproteobacteria bacterium]|nr:DUF302 domain-containing protein [Gammaproteobacteria bacterium]